MAQFESDIASERMTDLPDFRRKRDDKLVRGCAALDFLYATHDVDALRSSSRANPLRS